MFGIAFDDVFQARNASSNPHVCSLRCLLMRNASRTPSEYPEIVYTVIIQNWKKISKTRIVKIYRDGTAKWELHTEYKNNFVSDAYYKTRLLLGSHMENDDSWNPRGVKRCIMG